MSRLSAPHFRTLSATVAMLALAACGDSKSNTTEPTTAPEATTATQLETEAPSATIIGLGNLIQNSSFETAGAGGAPASWSRLGYGSVTPTFTYPVTGRSGKAAQVSLGAASNADARWQHAPVTVLGGLKYTVRFWYKSTTTSQVGAEFTSLLGRLSYAWLAQVPSSNGQWKQYTATFSVPLLQKRVAVFQSIKGAGSLVIDDVALVLGTSVPQSPPPTAAPAPTLTFASNPSTVVAGQPVTLTWSSTNADVCTASGLWSGAQPTSGSLNVTPSASGTYSLTCGGSGGSLTKNAPVTVTPAPVTPGEFTEGMFSFSFDDSWESQYLNAIPVLDAAGYKATFYLTTSQIEQGFNLFMTPAQVIDIAARGHEIAGHTLTHPDLTTLSDAQVLTEIVDSRNYLRALTGKPVNGFAHPFGAVSAQTQLLLTQSGYTHARGVGYPQQNTASAPKYNLYSQCIESTTPIEEVRGRIDTAKANKQWFILCMHAVQNSGGDNLTITPAFLQQIVDYVKQSGIKVVTVEAGRAMMP